MTKWNKYKNRMMETRTILEIEKEIQNLTARSKRRSKETDGGNVLINTRQKTRERCQITVFYGTLYTEAAIYTEDMETCPVVDVDDGFPGFAFSAYHYIRLPRPTTPKRSSSLPTFV